MNADYGFCLMGTSFDEGFQQIRFEPNFSVRLEEYRGGFTLGISGVGIEVYLVQYDRLEDQDHDFVFNEELVDVEPRKRRVNRISFAHILEALNDWFIP